MSFTAAIARAATRSARPDDPLLTQWLRSRTAQFSVAAALIGGAYFYGPVKGYSIAGSLLAGIAGAGFVHQSLRTRDPLLCQLGITLASLSTAALAVSIGTAVHNQPSLDKTIRSAAEEMAAAGSSHTCKVFNKAKPWGREGREMTVCLDALPPERPVQNWLDARMTINGVPAGTRRFNYRDLGAPGRV